MHYFVAMLLLIVIILSFYFFGYAFNIQMNVKHDIALEITSGMFSFFTIYNIGYLVCLAFHLNIIHLCCWSGLVFLGGLAYVIVILLNASENPFNIDLNIRKYYLYYFLFLVLFVLLFYYVIRYCYYGWDTAYYVNEISDAATYGTFYKNWNANSDDTAINLRYALCAYYMFLAVLTKISGVPAIIVARVIGGGACVVLSTAVAFCFGKMLLHTKEDALRLTIIWNLINYIYISIYTANAFLIERTYEGKAWCSNVIIPFLLIIFFCIYNCENEEFWWTLCMFVSFSCNSISMTMLLIAPLMVTGLSFLTFLKHKKISVIKHWAFNMCPLIFYVLLITLQAKKWLIFMS